MRSSLASRNASHGAADALADAFEPLALIDALTRHEVDYVIVGGTQPPLVSDTRGG